MNSIARVSVIIAARNEELTIGQCLSTILKQTYPLELVEIIVVDDHSTDATLSVAGTVLQAFPQKQILSLSGDQDSHGKPAAIAYGLQHSSSDILLFTDADCLASPCWIESTVAHFEHEVAFVAGAVLEEASSTFLSALSSLEFLSLITTAAGLIGAGKPIICNGANIAYRKSAFQKAGGFGEQFGSCDDETIMQRMILRSVGTVRFNFDPRSRVFTKSPATIRQFWLQRTRWASKQGHYEDRCILWKLLALYSFFVVMLISGILVVYDSSLIPILSSIALLKALIDYRVLAAGARIFQIRLSLFDFFIAEIFHVPYIAIAALVGQVASIRWKNRTVTA
ncbi:MAG: glycosyltransferase [bacterium]